MLHSRLYHMPTFTSHFTAIYIAPSTVQVGPSFLRSISLLGIYSRCHYLPLAMTTAVLATGTEPSMLFAAPPVTSTLNHPSTTSTAAVTTTRREQQSLNHRSPYPRHVGHRFSSTGQALPFAGNSIICHLSPSSSLYRHFTTLRQQLSQSPLFSSMLAFLPPTSYHMTVYEGITYHIPERFGWLPCLSPDASLPLLHATVVSKLALLATTLPASLQAPYRFRIVGFNPLVDGLAVRLAPATPAEEAKMRALRDLFADTVGARMPGHAEYIFHSSFAYLLRWLDEGQRRELQGMLDAWLESLEDGERDLVLGPAELCVFDDLTAFRKVFDMGGLVEE
jgi:hypothetical protein